MRDHLRASVLRDRELFASSLVAASAIDERDLPVARELVELAFDPALYNLTPQGWPSGIRPLELFGPYAMEFLAPVRDQRVRSAAP